MVGKYGAGFVKLGINYLPNDKISHWSKVKASADDKINETEKK